MLTIKASGSVKDIIEHAKNLHGNAVPYAAATALTRTAHLARTTSIPEEMRRVFKEPRPYTLNALFVVPAKKDNLSARIAVKNQSGRGTKQEHYLLPSVEGGRRNAKRMERALQMEGLLRGHERVVPTRELTPEQYESGAFIRRVLKDVQERTPRKGVRRFAGAVGKRKIRGIWEAKDSGKKRTIRPLFIFTNNQPSYRSVFGFQRAARETAEKHFREQFNNALAAISGRFK